MSGLLTLAVWISVLGLVHSLPPSSFNLTSGGGVGGSVPTWCGKAYRRGDPAIDPGGRIEPAVLSKLPLLDLKIQQRQAPYLASDTKGSFIVDTSLSYIHGQAYSLRADSVSDQVVVQERDIIPNLNASALSVTIIRTDTGASIVTGNVRLNVSDNEIAFPLFQFRPSLQPYGVEVRLRNGRSGSDYRASTQLIRLPNPTDGRLVTKIDNLYQSMLIPNNGRWETFFPYSFYTASSAAEVPKLEAFAKAGYNVLHVIPPYDFNWFDEVADEAERLGMWIMYDMRHTYRDEKKVKVELQKYMKRKNLLLWYTADEPDGNVDPVGLPKKIYDVIKEIDPYHPVSLCLNCANYFFEPYSKGADILLSDVYPIGTNTRFSIQFGTVCNSTYGCCGCDNCSGEDSITNIADRLSLHQTQQTQLGLPQKPLWTVPQAFGAGEHWSRIPSQIEEAAMTMLGVNHGAKGVMMWTWPTTDELAGVTSLLAGVLTKDLKRWVLGAKHLGQLAVTVLGVGSSGDGGVDASAWVAGEGGGEMLISVVNTAREAQRGAVSIEIPDTIMMTGFKDVFWGHGGSGAAPRWSIPATGSRLVRAGIMPALAVDVFSIKMIGALAGSANDLTNLTYGGAVSVVSANESRSNSTANAMGTW